MNGDYRSGVSYRLPAMFLLLTLLLGGCATIKTGSHRDETASFEGYRTFSWIADNPMIVGQGARVSTSPLTQKKIVDTIVGELTRKGFVYTSNRDEADFVLAYTVGTRERIEATSYPSAYRGTWGWHLYGRHYYEIEVEHRMYTEGTLGVDIFDGKTKQPVWHGWASKTISTSDRQDPATSIAKAVTALFAKFPPTGR
ncbi:MAG TPA: DUF4136 domain-containing protein [Woeseiaceae bacterium]|nr:DUF4136 domain-containing protein [Woeseiaceae bacterium]